MPGSPANILDAEVLDKRGFTNLADALNEIPSFGAGVSGITTGSGQNVGQEFLDLFDLGTQRTLVVVNGRRFVPGNVLSADPIGRVEGSQVDINNIPVGLIERVETLGVGGAPIYGADAIAGTVNIVLRDDFEGAEFSAQYSDYLQTNAATYNITGLFGANFSDGRGNVTASVQYEEQLGAVANDFPTLSNQDSFFANGANVGIIGPEFVFNILEGAQGYLPAFSGGIPLPNFGGANLFRDPNGNILTFAGDGGLSVFNPGVPIGTSATGAPGSSGFDLNDFEEAIVPVERFVFSSTAHYDINNDVRVFLETNFLNSSSADLVSQSGTAFNTAFLGAQGQGAFSLPIDNPFISPGDRSLLVNSFANSEAARLAGAQADLADLLADPDADPDDIAALQATIAAGAQPLENIFLNGINLGILPNAGANFVDTTTFRVVGGLQGDFEYLGRNFSWEVSGNFGRTQQTRAQSEVIGGAFFNAALSTALDADQLAQLTSDENVAAIVDATGSDFINVIRNGELLNVNAAAAQQGDVVCSAFVNAPGAVDSDGDNGIVDPTDTPTPNGFLAGCTPLNLFTGALPASAAQLAAIDFITGPAVSSGEVNQVDFLAFISGEVVRLPAGWVEVSGGFERRREFGSFTSSGFSQNAFSREPAIVSVPQEELVYREFYGEARIPVLSSEFNLGINDFVGFDLIDRLEFNGSYRRINPSVGPSSNVYSAGGQFGLFGGDLTLRGNYTRSVRQPSLVELFSPQAQAFDQTGDPCDISNISDNPDSNRQANCVAQAVALGFSDAFVGTGADGVFGLVLAPGDNAFSTPSINAAVPLLTGGNPFLTQEIGTSFTGGFIWQPKFVPGLTLGADYISIDVADVIAEPDFSFFTQTCLDTSLSAPECNNFTRVGPQPASDGSLIGGFDIVSGLSGFANSETLQFDAVQGQIRYGFDIREAANLITGAGPGYLGSLDLGATFLVPIIDRDSAASVQVQRNGKITNFVGTTGRNDLEFTADASWTYNQFNFFWRSIYQDGVTPCLFRVEGDCADIPSNALPLPRDVITHRSPMISMIT